MHQWVSDSFSALKSIGAQNIFEIQRPFPIITDYICKQIPTALIFTSNSLISLVLDCRNIIFDYWVYDWSLVCVENTEFVDDLITFQELGGHLEFNGCHVANLLALDFSQSMESTVALEAC